MVQKDSSYTIRFTNTDVANASHYAEELRNEILDASPDVIVQRKRDEPLTQDLGSTLVLLLGTPTIVAVANAIGNWLQRHNNASITIEDSGKKIIVQNLNHKEATKLAEILRENINQKNK